MNISISKLIFVLIARLFEKYSNCLTITMGKKNYEFENVWWVLIFVKFWSFDLILTDTHTKPAGDPITTVAGWPLNTMGVCTNSWKMRNHYIKRKSLLHQDVPRNYPNSQITRQRYNVNTAGKNKYLFFFFRF